MLKNISIAKKLPALFAALTTISVVSVGWLSYVEIAQSMEKDVLSKLSATQQTVGHSFKKMLGRIDSDLEVMAQTRAISCGILTSRKTHTKQTSVSFWKKLMMEATIPNSIPNIILGSATSWTNMDIRTCSW